MGPAVNSKTILITGVRGFIGSRVARALFDAGHHVIGLTREIPDTTSEDNAIKMVQGDFGDAGRMAEVLSEINPDIIIQAAGVTPHSVRDEKDYNDVNLHNSKSFLETITSYREQAGEVIPFINLSSIGVYGVPTHADGTVREDDPGAPLSPYAQSKYDFEQILMAQYNIPYLNIRIANIPGRDSFINYVVGNKRVGFHGDIPYSRDYIHPQDLCDLIAKGVAYLYAGGESVTLNAGSGVGYEFPDIVAEIERQTGVDIERVYNPPKQGDVIKIICNIDRAKRVLGWEPAYTDLKDIIDYALRHR